MNFVLSNKRTASQLKRPVG